RCYESRFDHQVRLRPRLTKQDVACGLLGRCDSGRPNVWIAHLARSQPRTTGAAMPRLAAMGEVEPGGESCLQHGLPGPHADNPAVRLDADGVVVGCQG